MVELPVAAAWRHLDVRVGFEVLFLRCEPDGYHLEGHSRESRTARHGASVTARHELDDTVRAPDLRVERLEQHYLRLPDDGEHLRYDYTAPVFDYQAELVYDAFGLLLDYPGIAVRVS